MQIKEEYYSDGNLASKNRYLNNELYGLQEGWHLNGCQEYCCNYINGNPHGLQEGWHLNGCQEYRCNYVNGKLHGLQEGWYENEQQEHKENYINNKKHGLQKYWYENGQERHRENYLNGKPHGLQEGWYLNGCQEYRCNYVNGKLHGLKEGWYERTSLDTESKQKYKENYICMTENIHDIKHGIQINDDEITYYKYNTEITKDEYEQYLNSIKKGILNILQIGKNTLDSIIKNYLV